VPHLAIAAVAVAALAAALRLPALGEYWLNPDEGIYYSVIAWPDLARRQAEIAENAHPPFFYHLLWAWSRVSMEFAWLRALAALAGCVAVLAFLLLGRRIGAARGGIAVGVAAAVLLAVAPAAVTQARLIRPYALQVALIAFALLGLLTWSATRRRGPLAAFSACSAVALLTHYSSALALAAGFAPVLVAFARGALPRAAARELGVALVLPAAAAAWIGYAHLGTQLAGSALHAHAYATWLRPHLAESALHAWLLFLGFVGYAFGEAWSASGALAWFAAVGCAFRRRMPRIWLPAVLAFVIALALSVLRLYPFGPARHSSWLLPFLIVPIAWAAVTALSTAGRTRWIGAAVLAALVFGRAPLLAALSGGLRAATLGGEHVMLRAHVPLALPLLDALRATPGPVLISADAFATLTPLWLTERAQARTADGLRAFRWGAREVVVHPSWQFSLNAADLDAENHFYRALLRADRAFPELGIARQNRLSMIFAGFNPLPVEQLRRYDALRRSPHRLVHDVRGITGITLLEFDAARFLAEAEAELRRLPEHVRSGGR